MNFAGLYSLCHSSLVSLAAFEPLPIFPESGLSSSIITTCLVGLTIMVFFNETYGWVLSGMVVPGYLAPIFIIHPWSGAVIVFEALMTYCFVLLISDYLSRTRIWSMFFGRDRFFAFLVFGIVIRALSEGFLFHIAGAWFNKVFGVSFDYRNNLYSIGLVVVPLMANMFWKTGLRRGVFPIGTLIASTYLVIRYILIPYTNFSISSFELSYGYYAVSFLGNVKAYIILLTAAFIASRTNLIYGWDYNGILVPSLLALAWLSPFGFSPVKIIATFVEAVIVLNIARFLATRKVFETVTIEGGRKILLVFIVGFTVKLIIGFYISAYYPGFKVNEIYGFGYILPSLIASKMWQKGSVSIIARPILQTSALAMIGGSLVSVALNVVLPIQQGPSGMLAAKEALKPIVRMSGTFYNCLLTDKAKLLRKYAVKGFDRAYSQELDSFREAVRSVQAAVSETDKRKIRLNLVKAARALDPIGYEIIIYKDQGSGNTYYYLRERVNSPDQLHGWGLYLFNTSPANDLVVEVPRPLSEKMAIEGAYLLFEHLKAKALFIHGAHYMSKTDGSSDAMAFPFCPFHAAHQEYNRDDILQVRSVETPQSAVYFKSEFPEGLDMKVLRSLIGPFEVFLPGQARLKGRNIQKESSMKTFTTIAVKVKASHSLVGKRFSTAGLQKATGVLAIDGYLLNWMYSDKEVIAPTGSEAYVPPSLPEVLFMDEEILSPIRELQKLSGEGIDPEPLLGPVAQAASHLNYSLQLYTYEYSGEQFLILRESPGKRRYWGTYVFRLGRSTPYFLEVPHPVTEIHTLEAGVRLFKFLKARALFIAGASKHANSEEAANVSHPKNIRNIFQLAHQVWLRSEAPESVLAVQIKGYSRSLYYTEADIVLSTGEEIKRPSNIPPLALDLVKKLSTLGVEVDVFDGSIRTLRFKGLKNGQYNYSSAHFPGTFSYLWLSTEFREVFRSRAAGEENRDVFTALGVKEKRGNLAFWIISFTSSGFRKKARGPLPDRKTVKRILDLLWKYGDIRNVLDLAQAKELADSVGAEIVHFVELSTNREFIVLLPPLRSPRFVFVLNLYSQNRYRQTVDPEKQNIYKAVTEFLELNYESVLIHHADFRLESRR
jgi:hypothetical protein